MGRLANITLKSSSTGEREKVKGCTIKKNKGIVGDANWGSTKNITILDHRLRSYIEDFNKEGLCMVRFKENFSIQGLDNFQILRGAVVHIGEGAVRVDKVGKKCFSQCKLNISGKSCPLAHNVIFGNVIEDGEVEVGDSVWVEL